MDRLPATRTLVALLVVTALVAGGVLGSITWVTASARAAGEVSADWELVCPETRTGRDGEDQVVWSRPGWYCQVDVEVDNRSGRAVRVTGLTGRRVGVDSQVEARALPGDRAPLAQLQDGPDAAWDVDLLVPPHESRTVSVAIGWRQEGCNGAGTLTLEPWARLRFETLQREHQLLMPQPLVLRTFDDPHDRRACPEDRSGEPSGEDGQEAGAE